MQGHCCDEHTEQRYGPGSQHVGHTQVEQQHRDDWNRKLTQDEMQVHIAQPVGVNLDSTPRDRATHMVHNISPLLTSVKEINNLFQLSRQFTAV